MLTSPEPGTPGSEEGGGEEESTLSSSSNEVNEQNEGNGDNAVQTVLDPRNLIDQDYFLEKLQDPGEPLAPGGKAPKGCFTPKQNGGSSNPTKFYRSLYQLAVSMETKWRKEAKWPHLPRNATQCRHKICQIVWLNRILKSRVDVDDPDILQAFPAASENIYLLEQDAVLTRMWGVWGVKGAEPDKVTVNDRLRVFRILALDKNRDLLDKLWTKGTVGGPGAPENYCDWRSRSSENFANYDESRRNYLAWIYMLDREKQYILNARNDDAPPGAFIEGGNVRRGQSASPVANQDGKKNANLTKVVTDMSSKISEDMDKLVSSTTEIVDVMKVAFSGRRARAQQQEEEQKKRNRSLVFEQIGQAEDKVKELEDDIEMEPEKKRARIDRLEALIECLYDELK